MLQLLYLTLIALAATGATALPAPPVKPTATPTPQAVVFLAPATYTTDAATGHSITFNKDHTFKVTTNVRCFKAPCPQAGGSGVWIYNKGTSQLSLHQDVDSAKGWEIDQVWNVVAAQDPAVGGIKVTLASAYGSASGEVPMPTSAAVWQVAKSALSSA
ncbi:hypothetical protein BC828DRAFT_373893 [Blastocladiella britannica]|nr:hypothetical protein BC828DRAFT_373893 [Blastocladiella britannica]